MRRSTFAWLAMIAPIIALGAVTGCSSSKSKTDMTDLERELETKEQKLSSLESSVGQLERKLSAKESELSKKEAALREAQAAARSASSTGSTTGSTSNYSNSGMNPESALPNASVGECYAKVWIEPVYKTESEKVLKREASERLEIIPAKYEWIEEKVQVKPASKKIATVPAVYTTETEKVLDTPAHTIWKKGRGPIEKVDNSTGEIMCLVEVPATYKTISKRVLKTSATTRETDIAAEYKTVRVKKVVQDETVKRIPIEAQYTTVTKRMLVEDGKMEWRPVLCETNMSGNVVSDLQQALKKAGFNPGPVDGVYGGQTRAAVRSFQKSKGLSTGGLTMKTLQTLGVRSN